MGYKVTFNFCHFNNAMGSKTFQKWEKFINQAEKVPLSWVKCKISTEISFSLDSIKKYIVKKFWTTVISVFDIDNCVRCLWNENFVSFLTVCVTLLYPLQSMSNWEKCARRYFSKIKKILFQTITFEGCHRGVHNLYFSETRGNLLKLCSRITCSNLPHRDPEVLKDRSKIRDFYVLVSCCTSGVNKKYVSGCKIRH